jgi:glycosyltransferase involved in cell wall biosynthesis
MPIYNCAPFLREALASLLIQTFSDFEVIAINDGSTDNSLSILEEFAKIDTRIKVINQPNNGIVEVLNRGVEEANAEYIARMDGDDICFPNRFEDQIEILENNRDIVMVAGDFEVIDQASEFLYRELVLPDNDGIKRAFYLRNVVAHGSTIFKKSAIQKVGGYRSDFGPTEDLDLWMRLSKLGDFASTATPVYKWRMNKSGITLSNNSEAMRQGKAHIDQHWKEDQPMYLTRKELMKKASSYYLDYEKHGAYYKQLLLTDTSQIAAKLFTHGYRLKGVKQLIVVASTGRVGLRTALKRVHLIGQGHYNKLRKYAKFGRNSLD